MEVRHTIFKHILVREKSKERWASKKGEDRTATDYLEHLMDLDG